MKNFKFYFFIFTLLNYLCLYSQLPGNLDSLWKAIGKMPQDTSRANRLILFASKTVNFDTAVSGVAAREALGLFTKYKDHKGLGSYFNYCGKLDYQTQRFQKAKFNFRKAIIYYTKVNFNKGIASAYNNLGVISTEKSEFDSAVFYFELSLSIQKKIGNQEGIGNCYQNTANALNLKGDYKGAMSSLLKAKDIYEEINFSEGLANVYYNLGYIHYNLKQLKAAEENILRALEIRETKTFNKVGISYCLVFLARLYSDEGAFKNNHKAKGCYQKVLNLSSETGDRLGQISALQGLGKIYFEEGKSDSLLSCSTHALELSKEIGQSNYISSSLSQVAESYLLLKKFPLAIQYYKEAIDFSLSHSDKVNALQSTSGLSKTFFSIGNYKEAYEYSVRAMALKDSVFNTENMKTASDLEAKYENQKKMLEIENLNKDKKIKQQELVARENDLSQKNKLLVIIITSLVVLGLFAFYAFRNYKKVEKANLIISSQKEQVEIQKDLIASQKILVEEKQKEMIDSIQYAKKIQHAVLTGEEIWNRVSREHFIFYQPKDIVSGDFYWAYHTPNNRSIWVVADCTGHGVPGGFMSMLGNSFLNEIVVDKRIYKPDEILNRLREKVISALEQKGESSQQDGMDISVAVWNKVENKFEFSAANNSGILIRDGEVVDLAADKMPVGKYLGKENPFTIQSFELKKGDTIYLFTDGFADQFGGDKGKKLKYRNFVNLLLELSSGNMQFQESLLRQKFKDWKGDLSQTDDVCVLGVRVS